MGKPQPLKPRPSNRRRSRDHFKPHRCLRIIPLLPTPSPGNHRDHRRSRVYPHHTSNAKVVTYQDLHPDDFMYRKIEDLITNGNIIVDKIVKVHNPYLERAYRAKEEEKKKEFGDVRERLLFHGTRSDNVNSICTNNFDWRLYGSNRGHKYGKGVSFSPNASYASNYSDPDKYNKVMIVSKVLVSKTCQGHENMSFPPLGFDTSQKGDNGIVIVKYEDHEFYPAYVLHYHFYDESPRDYDYSWRVDYYDDYYRDGYHFSIYF